MRQLHSSHRPHRDVIIRGGENIYPREVEEFLYTPQNRRSAGRRHPPRAPRRNRCRLGPPGPGVEATEAEIHDFCNGQIAYYKIPEYVRFVTEFPATLSGKIQKYKIREFEIEARGLQSVAGTTMA